MAKKKTNKPSTYTVSVVRSMTVEQDLTVEVEADSEDKAKKMAVEKAKSHRDRDWNNVGGYSGRDAYDYSAEVQ